MAVVTQDVIGERLAGPAIRALAMGRHLVAAGHDVRIASAAEARHPSELVVDGALSPDEAAATARWADVVVVQGDVLTTRPALGTTAAALVSDLYDPFQMEGLVRGVALPPRARYAATRRALEVLSAQLQRGDLFLCASERQRLFWLGHLDAAGRVNPATYDADPGLRQLLAIVPFGIDDAAPSRTGEGLRGRLDGIDGSSRIVLWGGGVYDWLDPLPVIEAMAELLPDLPDLRLVFMGTKHPNPAVPEPAMLRSARTLVAERELAHAVLFNDAWVPYEERQNVLLDAEIGVSGHLPHVETELAFRTRILDYVWAGLPIVATEGDALGDLVEANGLGATVPPGDAGATAAALRSLLLDGERAERARGAVRAIAPAMRWSEALRPLLEFCAAPRPAADRDATEAAELRAARSPRGATALDRGRDVAESVRSTLAAEGPRGLAAKVSARVRARGSR